ncbi:NUDIX hydrolase [Salinarchaeum sp. Harcht-Bsk1]|uniref:NUDIX hydrolase n=1 Tax=Salinarchaeum sp. Harcht-Bsk1 TaxID=1333523 RepID=UPI000677B235|nr:NUDIX hydrolase [Salinarchaeum sp. Harcht-Bsk1]
MSDDELAWETLSSEVAYECPGFEIVHDDVRLPDGTETDYDYLTEPPAVVVLPFVADDATSAEIDADDREVVVIEEWRQAVGRLNRGIPVGSVEPEDDDLTLGAHRELREETGYEADSVEHVLTTEPVNGIANSVLHYFVAEGCTPTAEQDLDANETIRVDTASLADLRSAALADDLRDGRAVTALQHHALRERGN